MRILNAIVLILLITTTGLFAQNRELPDVTIQDLSGKKVAIQDYGSNGKITVLNFWATWCVPCKKELDNVAELYPEWVEKYDMELIAISVDNARTATKVKPMVNAKGWEFEVLLDQNNDLKRALNFQEVPYTFLIDQEGNIVYSHGGYVEGFEYEMEDMIKELAGVEDAPKEKKKKKSKSVEAVEEGE